MGHNIGNIEQKYRAYKVKWNHQYPEGGMNLITRGIFQTLGILMVDQDVFDVIG